MKRTDSLVEELTFGIKVAEGRVDDTLGGRYSIPNRDARMCIVWVMVNSTQAVDDQVYWEIKTFIDGYQDKVRSSPGQ